MGQEELLMYYIKIFELVDNELQSSKIIKVRPYDFCHPYLESIGRRLFEADGFRMTQHSVRYGLHYNLVDKKGAVRDSMVIGYNDFGSSVTPTEIKKYFTKHLSKIALKNILKEVEANV
jgi:hypothetical protein